MINAQTTVYNISSIHVIFFFQCLFKAGSFVVNLHKRSSPSYMSTINYFQNRPQMFVQIHYGAPMPTLLCNAKYFLFCGKHLKCSNGQHTRVGTLIVATIYLQLIQNRYMFRSFTVLQCSHQHCVQPVAAMWKS